MGVLWGRWPGAGSTLYAGVWLGVLARTSSAVRILPG
jgi:hypothetical protein